MDRKLLHKLFLLVISVVVIGCGPNEEILKSNSNQVTVEPSTVSNSKPTYDTVESEVENMRTADFDFIFVLRRKDGGVMQPDDKAYVRTNAVNANRRSLVDGGRAIVIGANAGTLGDVVKKLAERFDVQDFSKPKAENANSNPPANANMH